MQKEQKKKAEPRYIYKKDHELSQTGFTVYAEAVQKLTELERKYPEPQYRTRSRLRTRTNTWDIVVKVRTEVKEPIAKVLP